MVLTAAAVVATAPACTTGATPPEACQVACACRELLPARRATCESECVDLVQTQHFPSQACLQCMVDVEECHLLESECGPVCAGFVFHPPAP